MARPSMGLRGPTAEMCSALAELAQVPPDPRAVDVARIVVVDGIGCLVAGAVEPAGEIARTYALGSPGTDATIVGAGATGSVDAAAFANGVALHCLDFEAIGSPPCHGTSYILPALLALAERDGATGIDVLRAFVHGWDVECRLRSMGSLRSGFHPSGVYGPIAAAAACAVLLQLDAATIEVAIGLAASSSAGLVANVPTMAKAVHAGNAARIGVQSALMASMGFTAASAVLEGGRGFVQAFVDGAPAPGAIGEGWGQQHFLVDPGVNLKRFPVQNPLQTLVAAVIDARPSEFDAADLDVLEIIGPPHIVGQKPRMPDDGHAGRFDAGYCAAVAVVDGDVGLHSFTDAAWQRVTTSAVADRIRMSEGPVEGGKHAVSVRLVTRDGQETRVERAHYRGSVQDPMTEAERLAKVRGCLAHGGREAVADELIELLQGLPTVPHVGELMELLRGASALNRRDAHADTRITG